MQSNNAFEQSNDYHNYRILDFFPTKTLKQQLVRARFKYLLLRSYNESMSSLSLDKYWTPYLAHTKFDWNKKKLAFNDKWLTVLDIKWVPSKHKLLCLIDFIRNLDEDIMTSPNREYLMNLLRYDISSTRKKLVWILDHLHAEDIRQSKRHADFHTLSPEWDDERLVAMKRRWRDVIYTMMWDNRNDYWDKKWTESDSYYELNQKWLQLTTNILTELFDAYDELWFVQISDFITPGALWTIEWKLKNNKLLTHYDIDTFFSYLLNIDDELIVKQEALKEKIIRSTMNKDEEKNALNANKAYLKSRKNFIKWQRSDMLDRLQTMLYALQLYPMQPLLENELSQYLESDFTDEIDLSMKSLFGDIKNTEEYVWHTNARIKNLFSYSLKIWRRKNYVWDGMWWEVYFSAKKFLTNESRENAIEQMLPIVEARFVRFFEKNGYKVKILKKKWVNKYKNLTRLNESSFSWKFDEFTPSNREDFEDNFRYPNYFEKSSLSKEQIKLICDTLIDSKTWSTWKFEDFKTKFIYELYNTDDELMFNSNQTWGFEFAFKRSDTENESWHSSHRVALVSEKIIDTVSRWSANVWFEECLQVYKKWIQTHLTKLLEWKDGKYNMPKWFVDDQFSIQNMFQIWDETIFFTELRENPQQVDKIILQLLDNQLNENKMIPILYKSEFEKISWCVMTDEDVLCIPRKSMDIYSMYDDMYRNKDISYWYRFIRHVNFPSLLTGMLPNTYMVFGAWSKQGDQFIIKTDIVSDILSNFINLNSWNAKIKNKFLGNL